MPKQYAFAKFVRYGVFTPVGESNFDPERAEVHLRICSPTGSIGAPGASVLTYK